MKSGRLNLRISEKRLAKLKVYAENREKTVTQLVEGWIDKLPSLKIDDFSTNPLPNQSDD